MKKYKYIKAATDISNEDIRKMLSTKVLRNISDGAIQDTVREIIFNCNTDMDWNKVYDAMIENMPELSINK